MESIGFYSENALSAVSMAFPFQTLFSALNVGIGVGMSQHISLSRGKGNTQTAKETAAQGVLLSVICAAIFLIWGRLFSGRFFALSKVYGEIAAMGKTYLMIVTVFSLEIFCESAYERILMALGHTRLLNLVWWAFTFAEVIGDAVSAMFLVRTYRSLQSL